jgi:hypothetical protein
MYQTQVARRGTRMFGMPAPTIIRFEAEIDAELAGSECSSSTADSGFSDCGRGIADSEDRQQRLLANEDGVKTMTMADQDRKQFAKQRPRQAIAVDMMSLDEMVRIVSEIWKGRDVYALLSSSISLSWCDCKHNLFCQLYYRELTLANDAGMYLDDGSCTAIRSLPYNDVEDRKLSTRCYYPDQELLLLASSLVGGYCRALLTA